jgi:hypothetical protein
MAQNQHASQFTTEGHDIGDSNSCGRIAHCHGKQNISTTSSMSRSANAIKFCGYMNGHNEGLKDILTVLIDKGDADFYIIDY